MARLFSAGSATNVPPRRPRRATISPSASSRRSACWIVGRPTPKMEARSRSEGSDSPGEISRSAMCRRTCSATYSCARSCWIGSNSTLPAPVCGRARGLPALASTATNHLSLPRNPRQEAIEQPPRRGARAVGQLVGAFQQPVGIDALLIELVPVDLDPSVHDVGGHLGMELQAEAVPDAERLRSDRTVRNQLRARRGRERVEVPLKPGSLGDERGVLTADRKPADLRLLAAERATAEHAGQQLAAEADAEHRDIGLGRVEEQLLLALEPRDRIVEGGELRSERDDQVVVARVAVALLDVDPEHVLLGAALV